MPVTTTPENRQADLSGSILQTLPYLRRYARALTGNQTTGDRYAAATLEAILADKSVYDMNVSSRAALFRAFHMIWTSTGAPVAGDEDSSLERRARVHMAGLTKDSREALLLHSVEGFDHDEIGHVMQISAEHSSYLVDTARTEMEDSVRGAVLIIEDEALIAMDIDSIVTTMGHRVTGIARTHAEAVRLGAKERPDLILADIKLADNSSGIDAVRDLLGTLGEVPVIFITAFPDRLLTGTRPEPTFLIGKPYTEEQLRSAVSQAMFFASTATLQADEDMARV
jgi:DNA-directed RNA polymerase specialized sigma24 family protein/CheY-like chemotaxis protein